MAYSDQGGVWGDWGPESWADDSGTVQPNGPQVQANSVLTQSTEATGQDRWTGWLQTAGTNVLGYFVQRDAAKNGLTPGKAANGAPVYVSGAAAPVVGPGGMTSGGLLVIGAVVLAALVVTAKKG